MKRFLGILILLALGLMVSSEEIKAEVEEPVNARR